MFTSERLSQALVLLSIVAVGACSNHDRLNLLIVTFDTTRADHIGCYGNQSIQTPNIDRLAADGIRFEHAYAAAPITLPSHTTLMTGAYPMAHGVRDNGSFVVTEDQTTLAEILSARGWATAAAVGSFPLTSQFGLDQGFDLYEETLAVEYFDHLGRRDRTKGGIFFDERRAEQVNEALVPWIEAHHGEPFFALGPLLRSPPAPPPPTAL